MIFSHVSIVTKGKYCGIVVSRGSLRFVSANQKLKAVTCSEVGLRYLMVLKIILQIVLWREVCSGVKFTLNLICSEDDWGY